MKLYNPKTQVAYNSRTAKTGAKFVSIVERWETDAQGIPVKAYMSSREIHATRAKAYRYAASMARYQFRSHVAASNYKAVNV
jgi:hypothetical protein